LTHLIFFWAQKTIAQRSNRKMLALIPSSFLPAVQGWYNCLFE
jgi:hypothetical protein